VAQGVIDEHGPPDEVCPTHLVWYKNGPWKRTIAWRDGADHEFPMPHKDLLEQVVSYEPPTGRFDDLARFNGSVTVTRTRGEMAVRCDNERTNFLVLNLANDVATEVRTYQEARQYMVEKTMAHKRGEPDAYLDGIAFATDVGDVGDADDDMVGTSAVETEEMAQDVRIGEPMRTRRNRARPGTPTGARARRTRRAA
jgi:hypothetical protein